jgi:hypothetical protein
VVNAAIAGVGLASLVGLYAAVNHASTTIGELRHGQGRAAEEKVLAAGDALRRYVIQNRAALLPLVAGGAGLVVDPAVLRGVYLPPGWQPATPLGGVLAMVVALHPDGEPVGFVYEAAVASPPPRGARSAESYRLADAVIPVIAAVPGAPAPRPDGLAVSTVQRREAEGEGFVSRYAEAGDFGLPASFAEVRLDAVAVRNAAEILVGEVQAGAEVSTPDLDASGVVRAAVGAVQAMTAAGCAGCR